LNQAPKFDNSDLRGDKSNNIAIVDARTFVGFVKKCSRKSVINDSIIRDENKTTCTSPSVFNFLFVTA
jgi:hypothetical protein